MRLRNKFLLHFAGLVAVLMTAVMAVVHSRQAEVMVGQARKQALLIGRSIAASSVNSILVNDWTDLTQEAEEIVLEEDIVYVLVYDQDGRRIAHATDGGVDMTALGLDGNLEKLPVTEADGCAVLEHLDPSGSLHLLAIQIPAVYESEGESQRAGTVQIGFSLESIYRDLESVRARLVWLWVLGMSLGVISSVVLARRVTKPIEGVASVAERYARGELDHRVEVKTNDEIASLGNTLNHMASEIHRNLAEIGELNRDLEQKVIRRTADLNQRNEELNEALAELKRAQAQLIHSEKMASLGQLVAGVAHEINNPLNFIYNGIEPLKTSIEDMKEILSLVNEISSYSEADRSRLEELKDEIEYDETIAGVDELIGTIREGAQRATAIVKDLRNFSRLDEAELKKADVHEGIEGTITLLKPNLGSRIRVVREFGEVPEFEFRPAHLNQVFMNLLSNAEQAIADQGIITVRTSVRDGELRVEVEDDGCGIEDEHLDHVFEPFFTTKDVGKGTGLGLSISFGIVESHGGTIEVRSSSGEGSCFTVRIPLHGAATLEEGREESCPT